MVKYIEFRLERSKLGIPGDYFLLRMNLGGNVAA